MHIKKIDNEDINYPALAEKFGSIFNSSEWIKLYNNNLSVYGIFIDDNTLVGAFNLFNQKNKLINYVKNPPFSPHSSLFFTENNNLLYNKNSYQKQLIELVASFFEKMPYHILTISFPSNIIDLQPFIWKKYKVSIGYTYHIDLNQTIESIKNQFSTERSRNIKKALKDNLQVEQITDYKIIKKLISNTFSRKKTNIDFNLIDNILFQFANKLNSFAFCTYKEKIPIAATFCIFDKSTTYYLLGGYDIFNKHHGAGPLCMFEAIKYAKELGCQKFDFEGSMIPEVEKYFRGFGGEIIPYYSVNKANLLFEIILKFFKREKF